MKGDANAPVTRIISGLAAGVLPISVFLPINARVNAAPRFEAISTRVRDIRYGGWIVPGLSSPSKNAVAGTKRNGGGVRNLLA